MPQQTGLVLSSKILSIQFNQSHTFFTVGTERGFAFYRVDPLEKMCERDLGGGIGIAVQLYETNFFGLVGGGKNPKFPTCKFVLWDDYKGELFVEEVMKDRIVAVRLNHDICAILTRRHAKLYNMKDMSEKRKIKTYNNPEGVCALSSSRGSLFLCPGLQVGSVNVYDYAKNVERVVSCHDHPLKCLALNTTFDDHERAADGSDSMFATASDQGTLIRVFDAQKQVKVAEFRRGGDACEVYGVEFSRDSKCLVVTSNKGTVHIYSLSKEYENVSSRVSVLSGLASYFGSQWSPFCIDFASASQTMGQPQPGGKDFQPATILPVKHVACVTPLGEVAAAAKKAIVAGGASGGLQSSTGGGSPDAYRLLVVSEDGSYAIHDLQFKDTKSIAKFAGMLIDLKKMESQTQ